MLIPFRRIAINPPSLSLNEFLAWGMAAQNKGADALMLRLNISTINSLYPIIEKLKKIKTYLLVNTTEFTRIEGVSGLHFKEQAYLPEFEVEPNLILGKSCHDVDGILRAEQAGFSYVFLSPIFKTQTHPEAKPLGLDYLREACRLARIPVFALGGIRKDLEQQCLNTGAYGIAAITMFLD